MSAASPADDHAPARIAIVRLSHLGDVVLALPLFHALRERFPRAEIAWVVQEEFASLLEGLPGLARVICFARRGGGRAWLDLREALARLAPELVIDAQGNLKSALATLASGAPRRVGLARRDWREPLGAIALTESAAPVASGREHALERTLALCAHFGCTGAVRTDPALTDGELALGREQLTQLVGTEASRAVIVHVAEPSDVRSWPLAHFEQLVRALAREGRAVILFAGPREALVAREMATRLAGEALVAPWIGNRNLRELAALFAAAGRAGARFVGCDSGPMHLAAACGTRVVVLAGPTNHERTGPWPIAQLFEGRNVSAHVAVRSNDPPACAPCLRRECSHPRGPVCMTSIEPSSVEAALNT